MSPSLPGLWARSRTHYENLFVFVRQCSVSGWAHRTRWLLLRLFLLHQTSSAKAEFKDIWKAQNGWVSEEDLKDWHRCKDALARLKSKCNTGFRGKQRQEGACCWVSETNPLLTRGWNHLRHKRPHQLLISLATYAWSLATRRSCCCAHCCPLTPACYWDRWDVAAASNWFKRSNWICVDCDRLPRALQRHTLP